jgi:hypothetical protein
VIAGQAFHVSDFNPARLFSEFPLRLRRQNPSSRCLTTMPNYSVHNSQFAISWKKRFGRNQAESRS